MKRTFHTPSAAVDRALVPINPREHRHIAVKRELHLKSSSTSPLSFRRGGLDHHLGFVEHRAGCAVHSGVVIRGLRV